MSQHKVIVILKDEQSSANAFLRSIGADGDSFTVGLLDGSNTISHYVCGWLMDADQLDAITKRFKFIFDDIDTALGFMKLKRLNDTP